MKNQTENVQVDNFRKNDEINCNCIIITKLSLIKDHPSLQLYIEIELIRSQDHTATLKVHAVSKRRFVNDKNFQTLKSLTKKWKLFQKAATRIGSPVYSLPQVLLRSQD